MARGRFLTGTIASGILGAVLVVLASSPGFAEDPPKLTLAGSATFATDYMFRSISNTKNDPAVQPEFDVTYGMFFFTLWGSNTSFGKNVEIDYYAGITPKWGDITFTIAGNAYTYPGGDDIDYFELHTAAAYAKGPWSLAVHNYWSPDNFQTFGNSDAIEGDVGYSFTGKLFGFFTPSISGAVGFQSYDKIASDYTYWNAGLTLGFMKNWSADIRYYDTTYDQDQCFINTGNSRTACDARVVGAIKATF